VTRNPAVWRAAAAIPDQAWRKAKRMKHAQIAVCGYAPAGWPPDTATVVRRVKVQDRDISTDPRARRRGTIPKDQLALALDGLVMHVYAYSFIASNLDVSTPAKAVAVEARHRERTDIEDRIRDAKRGAALRHLPSGSRGGQLRNPSKSETLALDDAVRPRCHIRRGDLAISFMIGNVTGRTTDNAMGGGPRTTCDPAPARRPKPPVDCAG
jgi:hypothetical protein